MPRPSPSVVLAILLIPHGASSAPRAETAPQRFSASYGLSFIGIPVGEAALRAERRGDAYELTVEAGLKGLAGWFVDGSGSATSKGRLSRDGTVPARFSLDSRYSGVPVTVDMRLDAGTVRTVRVEPDPPPRPDRVPVRPADRSGVTDPIGMLAVPVGEGPLDPALCDRRIPVFDGTSRADLVLSRGAVSAVADGPYRGPALDCRVRWVPVSGHRPKRPAVVRMAANDGMRVRLAPIPGGGLLVPLEISVDTGWGTARIAARTWGAPAEAVARQP